MYYRDMCCLDPMSHTLPREHCFAIRSLLSEERHRESRLAGRCEERTLRQRDLYAAVLAERAAREPWKPGHQRRQGRRTTTFQDIFHQLPTPPRSLGPLSPSICILRYPIRSIAA